MEAKTKNPTIYNATDPHLFFTFNDVYSRDWNLFIENDQKGGGGKIVASPDATLSFTSPDFQNNTYLAGVTKSQKTFSHTLAASHLTYDEVKQIAKWLEVGTKGFLFYDTDKNWGWDVVVSKLGDFTYYEAEEGFIVEFAIEFKTVNDWHARSLYSASRNLQDEGWSGTERHSVANKYGIPEIVNCVGGTTDKATIIYLPQVSNAHTYFELNCEWNGEQITACLADGHKIMEYQAKDTLDKTHYLHYFSQFGMTLLDETKLVETDEILDGMSSICELHEFNNEAPQEMSDFDAANFVKSAWLNYRCDFYKVTEGTKYGNGVFNDATNGNTYIVRIGIAANPDLLEDISYWPQEAPQDESGKDLPIAKIYVGKCNYLGLKPNTNSVEGTITLVKHNNF